LFLGLFSTLDSLSNFHASLDETSESTETEKAVIFNFILVLNVLEDCDTVVNEVSNVNWFLGGILDGLGNIVDQFVNVDLEEFFIIIVSNSLVEE